MNRHYLDLFFAPKSIALFGASPLLDKVGGRVFHNLISSSYKGEIVAVNPKHKQIEGHDCFSRLDEFSKKIDLAIIATPADTVVDILHQCGEHGVGAVMIISAGFNSGNQASSAGNERLLEVARRYNIRILGPNCLGFIRPGLGLNTTFTKNQAKAGTLALISQSGAICTAILDWAEPRKIGFSTVVSVGDAVDVDFGELLDYLALDTKTHSILLYIEGIKNARRFLSGLRIAARMKPVIIIKAGRHQQGSSAAFSHTGALVGDDAVFDAAIQRAGAVRVYSVEQLFAAAQILAMHQHTKGDRLGIITNAGGLGVLASDRATDVGVNLPELETETFGKLNAFLPAHWSQRNPVDILGDATPERYAKSIEVCIQDENFDALLVMLTPQAMSEPAVVADQVIAAAKTCDKPIIACWMGEAQMQSSRDAFTEAGIPVFVHPEAAIEAFSYLATYQRNQQMLMQTPKPLSDTSQADVEGAKLVVHQALAEKREILNHLEVVAVLHAFNIPIQNFILVRDANEALVAGEALGFPVALKIQSPDIVHKSDVNGVRLNVDDAHAIRKAYNDLIQSVSQAKPNAKIEGVIVEPMVYSPSGRELFLGVKQDSVFGPVLTVGSGGVNIEILKDRAVALPPLNMSMAGSLLAQTKAFHLLAAHRQVPAANLNAIVQVLRRLSELVCEVPEIRELDINPLLADEKGVIALDARIRVGYRAPTFRRYSHMAIHPYPTHLISRYQLADGTDITIRPIRPEDADIEQSFVRGLSAEAKYFRFMHALVELTPLMLIRFTQIDYDREMAFIAVAKLNGGETELGVARYVMNADGASCEFALVVDDEWQHKGIGSQLMTRLLEAARSRGFNSINGEVLANNTKMLELMKALEFTVTTDIDDPSIRLVQRNLGS